MTLSSVKRGLISDSMILGLPGAMAAPTATAGVQNASIAFTTVSGATSYSVVSNPATTTQTASSSPYTFTGLTAGTAYTFTIAATNSVGQGGFSQASNSITPTAPAPTSVEYLVVAGGGSGNGTNNNKRAGGGAGGYRTATGYSVTAGSPITITVGAGGADPEVTPPTNGSNSVFGTITSTGGGYGGSNTIAGQNGGSGGGGGNAFSYVPGGTGTAGQGNNGGSGFAGVAYGGGGGAGAVGGNSQTGGGGTGYAGGAGGDGLASSISGSSTYYAGGGGGSNAFGTSNSASGLGSGAANTGGGGPGGNPGNSGIVIIRYADTYGDAASTSGSPTFTTTGGYKIYKFTGSGTITF